MEALSELLEELEELFPDAEYIDVRYEALIDGVIVEGEMRLEEEENDD